MSEAGLVNRREITALNLVGLTSTEFRVAQSSKDK